ncbi:MAG TPA: vanadium-dependent haloperoxidase [Candidatus Limnocylindrales bacterium]|nr:vanadium-dependent haloperoxidase [Candidatus Limnocylindrales bacterium]
MTGAPVRAAALAILLALPAPANAAAQTAEQRSCINALAKSGAGVARAVARNLFDCMHAAQAGTLPPGQTAEQCLDADNDGRIADATARTLEAEIESCTVLPDFGASDSTAVNAAFTALAHAGLVFGADLDAAIAAAGAGTDASRCQAVVAKRISKVLVARLKLLNACAKRGLSKGTITSAAQLGACFAATKGDRGEPTLGGADTLAEQCATTNIASVFPGECASEPVATLAECIDELVECDAALATEAAGGLRTLRPHRYADGVATRYCGAPPAGTHSVARQWDEEILGAIRIDFPRPPIHARNLFHLSVAMWDAWAAYDPVSDGYLVTEKQTAPDISAARDAAISFAAYRVIASRYAISPSAAATSTAVRFRMNELGYDPGYVLATGNAPAAFGNRIAAAVLAYGLADGSNESINYADPTYSPVNEPMIVKLAGTTMADPNRWQPLALDSIVGQNGIPIPGKIQVFVGPHWGDVSPFAVDLPSVLPGPPPRLHDPDTDDDFKAQALDVIRLSSELTPDDPTTIDISPASLGNNPLGSNSGSGYAVNPVTGNPYAPQMVKRGDFGRVLAEFWADGPTSETPPGHWNTIANYVVDHPLFERRFEGTGPVVDALEWDVKMYLALNGAVHDAAIGAWGTKRVYDSVRPVSMIRYMGGLGQSSDSLGASFNADGLPLEPGLVEVITSASSMAGERHEALSAFVGEIAILAWPGDPADPATEYSGVRWVRAKTWVPYQRKTFVTPPFAGYISGHSTFSRSAAEVLTRLTGSPYFPGGLGEFTAPQDDFLAFEIGPSTSVTLEWASYYDAADQAGQSRIWGGIHITADDFQGRILGSTIGNDAYDKARTYYDGTAAP